MANRKGKPGALPRLNPEAQALMDALTRLIQAGHIQPGAGLTVFLKDKSAEDILAEADRLCGRDATPKRRASIRRPRAAAPSGSFDIEVSLREIQPRIWRRFTIKSSETFLDLHEAIQDAGGWTNSHLFAFRDPETGDPIAGLPSGDDDCCDPGPFAGSVRLDRVFPATGKARLLYEYDFGDNWQLDVTCHAHIPDPAPWQRRLTGGARAFPPDDCGGTGGYEECVEVAEAEKPTPAQKERLEWLAGWDPERFEAEKEAKGFDRRKRKRTGQYSR